MLKIMQESDYKKVPVACRVIVLALLTIRTSCLAQTILTDPTAASGGDSLLSAYVAEALKNHPDLASMQAMIEAEGSRVRMVSSWMNPDLMLGVMSLPTSLDFHEEAMTSIDFGFMLRIPFPGKLKSAREAQTARVSSSVEEYEQMKLDMAAMVKMAYYDLAGNLGIRDALLEGQRLSQDMVKAAQIMTSSGMGSQADILRAQLEADQWQRRIIENDQRIAASRSRLAAALGRTTAEHLQDPKPLAKTPPDPPLDKLLTEKIDQTPFRRSQWAKVESARQNLKRARLEYWPDVDLSFTYGFRDYLKPGAMGGDPEMRMPLDDMLSLEARILVPLFFRGNQRAMVQESEAMLRHAQAEYESGGVKLRDGTRQAYARLEAARRTYHLIADTLLPRADEVFEASLPDYQSGRIPFMSLNEALMQAVMQKMDREMALADAHMAQADLERLIGKSLAAE